MTLDQQAGFEVALLLIGALVSGVCWYARHAIERAEGAERAVAVLLARQDATDREILRLRDKVHAIANELAPHVLVRPER